MAKVPEGGYKFSTPDEIKYYIPKVNEYVTGGYVQPNTTSTNAQSKLNEHLMDMLICTLALQLGFDAIQLYKLNNAMRNMMNMSWDIQRKYEWLTQTAYAIKTGDEHYGGF